MQEELRTCRGEPRITQAVARLEPQVCRHRHVCRSSSSLQARTPAQCGALSCNLPGTVLWCYSLLQDLHRCMLASKGICSYANILTDCVSWQCNTEHPGCLQAPPPAVSSRRAALLACLPSRS